MRHDHAAGPRWRQHLSVAKQWYIALFLMPNWKVILPMGVLWLGALIWAIQTLLWQAPSADTKPASIAELKVHAKHARDLSSITRTISTRDHRPGGKDALLGAEHAED
jgi:hypothetical protein